MAQVMIGLVLDANILISAALGDRVRTILRRFRGDVMFVAPEVCRNDIQRRVPEICRKHDLDQAVAFKFVSDVEKVVRFIPHATYAEREKDARARVQARDPDDWPVIATALEFDIPIWTEDRDFFGCGVATWVTNPVEIYLRG
jgi:predicted nucleic acid-binding protein